MKHREYTFKIEINWDASNIKEVTVKAKNEAAAKQAALLKAEKMFQTKMIKFA